MRYCIAALVGLFAVGCATAPSDLNKVSMGMTKQQVIAAVGNPTSVRATQGVEYMIYHCREVSVGRQYFMAREGISGEMEADYYVRLVNGLVDAYGKQGDFDSTHIPEQKVDIDVNMHGTVQPSVSDTQPSPTPKTQPLIVDLLQAGKTALANKDYKSASDSFQLATSIFPDSQEAWTGLGMAFGMLHDFPSALFAARKSVELDPTKPLPLASLACIYAALGETNKYVETLEKVRVMDPAIAEGAEEFVKEEAAKKAESTH
jgi:tetratricopeptide (TPR) repeat protein